MTMPDTQIPPKAADPAGHILQKVLDTSLDRLFGNISEQDKAGVLEDYTQVVAVLNDFLGEIATINEIWARRMRDELGDKEGNIRRSKSTFADMLRIWADATNDFLDEREAAEEEDGAEEEEEADAEGEEGEDDAADGQVVDADFTSG